MGVHRRSRRGSPGEEVTRRTRVPGLGKIWKRIQAQRYVGGHADGDYCFRWQESKFVASKSSIWAVPSPLKLRPGGHACLYRFLRLTLRKVSRAGSRHYTAELMYRKRLTIGESNGRTSVLRRSLPHYCENG